mgnify:CR=1 FL=1
MFRQMEEERIREEIRAEIWLAIFGIMLWIVELVLLVNLWLNYITMSIN